MRHYRYQSQIIYHEYLPAIVKIQLVEFESVKETNYGYWIIEKSILEYYKINSSECVKPIFVLKQSKKRYAYPTQEEAFNSFVKRNNKRIAYLKRDLKNAENLKRQILILS